MDSLTRYQNVFHWEYACVCVNSCNHLHISNPKHCLNPQPSKSCLRWASGSRHATSFMHGAYKMTSTTWSALRGEYNPMKYSPALIPKPIENHYNYWFVFSYSSQKYSPYAHGCTNYICDTDVHIAPTLAQLKIWTWNFNFTTSTKPMSFKIFPSGLLKLPYLYIYLPYLMERLYTTWTM